MKIITLPLRVLFCVVFAICVWLCVAIGTAVMIFEDLWRASK